MHNEGHRVGVGFVSDGVWSSAGKRHSLAHSDRYPLCGCAKSSGVEDEFALDHVINLTGLVTMHHGRTSAWRHPDLGRKQRSTSLSARREHSERVGAQHHALRCVRIDR